MRQPQKKMNAYLDAKVLKRLDAIARKLKITRTELLQRIIAEEIGPIERLLGVQPREGN
jgi:tetrahydromethanopterin S-methyltransferase subunit G